MGVSATGTLPSEEFCDFTLAVGGDDGGARSVSHGCLRARGGRSSAIAIPFRSQRSGTWRSRLVAGGVLVIGADARSRYGAGGFGPKQFSRPVLDHGADASASREQWL